MPKHKHSDLMLLYAQDAAKTDKPWKLWEWCLTKGNSFWIPLEDHPTWASTVMYRRRIPEKTDLEKYGIEKGDVWHNDLGFPIMVGEVVGSWSFRDIDKHKYRKGAFTTLVFRRGVVDKLQC